MFIALAIDLKGEEGKTFLGGALGVAACFFYQILFSVLYSLGPSSALSYHVMFYGIYSLFWRHCAFIVTSTNNYHRQTCFRCCF